MSGGHGALFLEGILQKHLSPALNERINNYIFEEHLLKTCNNVFQLLFCCQISSNPIFIAGLSPTAPSTSAATASKRLTPTPACEDLCLPSFAPLIAAL